MAVIVRTVELNAIQVAGAQLILQHAFTECVKRVYSTNFYNSYKRVDVDFTTSAGTGDHAKPQLQPIRHEGCQQRQFRPGGAAYRRNK